MLLLPFLSLLENNYKYYKSLVLLETIDHSKDKLEFIYYLRYTYILFFFKERF